MVRVLVAQSYPNLCDSMDCSPPGSTVHGILQARILEWVAISSFKGSSWPRDQTWVSRIAGRLFTVWATKEALSPLCSIAGWQGPKEVTPLGSCSYLWALSARHGWLFVTSQAPLSMVFSRQVHWSELPFPISGDLPNLRNQTHISRVFCISKWIPYH